MTRVVVSRGSAGSSSSSNRSSSAPPSQPPHNYTHLAPKDEELADDVAHMVVGDVQEEHNGGADVKVFDSDTQCEGSISSDGQGCTIESHCEETGSGDAEAELIRQLSESIVVQNEPPSLESSQIAKIASLPPPPPVPPPAPSSANSSPRRFNTGVSSPAQSGLSRRTSAWPARTSPSESQPSSPKSHGDNEGYNSADEQNPCLVSFDNTERERQFELDIRRIKGFELRRMLEDGNCLFRAIADHVYGDSQLYDLVRQMCIDYMEQERDHFSQFVTEGFASYCRRKRRDKVYGNNIEIQVCSEMYNRPIHIYSYSTEPINIFHGSYNTDTPPIRLSYHHGNHYNSLVDPRRLSIGAGLGFSSLRGRNIDKEHVKAAIKAQQDEQIESALLAEGRFYSDLELTEKEIEASIMEASRMEYLAGNKLKQQEGPGCTSGAEPSSSGSGSSGRRAQVSESELNSSSSMQMVLSMGFNYMQVVEAYGIFGDDADSIVCYLLETSNRKGKAAE